ncbi:MAG: DUF5107 domain-containing protein, partial [Chloroflexota bacterium]
MLTTKTSTSVRVETVVIPTYPIGPPDKNPMFLEKRVYQGSSGVVYPHPIVEQVFDEKVDKPYTAITLENEYLEIMLLPEIGGRVQMARDKTNDYHFIYYNRVIKPALVGLTGPWISGGIEFNWPQHHRPSTFEPVDYLIKENDDGSQTVWFSEIERMFRTKGMVGFTLYPGRAYLELSVQLYNRTPLPQTFLWWANPAVHVNDDYQSIFPPDVHAVMDHGKRDVSSFPIATGTYYKQDYSPGTDISRYKNIPVPTSYMAYHSDFDFVGCYDHGKRAGMMHIANHHLVPGKKQWTWGNGDFGRAWDRQLTDEDGPYIELMCGAFTDNQPDFSWLQPGEEKRFKQIFLPYKLTGGAKNASKEVVINLEVEGNSVALGVYVTRPRTVRVLLSQADQIVFEQEISLDPTQALLHSLTADGPEGKPEDFSLRVIDSSAGKELISYRPLARSGRDIPEPATAAKPPKSLSSNEALYLNGLHLEQYRHATYAAEPYYQEGLRRDPHDSRCHSGLGRLLLSRGKFAEAATHFQAAVESLTRRNPNPYDGEPYYNLGQALKYLGRFGRATDAFYKATWNAAWQDSAYFELARLAAREEDWDEALRRLRAGLSRNDRHHQARHLEVAILRRQEKPAEAQEAAAAALETDPLSFGPLFERHLLTGDTAYRDLMRGYLHSYIELALDYIHAGLIEEGLALLQEAPADDPMRGYYIGWCHTLQGDVERAEEAFLSAARVSPDYCFPNRIEAVAALNCALQHNRADGFAAYYLGNFWYAKRQYQDAITCWEQASALKPNFPTVYRNLGLAYMNQENDSKAALSAYERAFELDQQDARLFFELDQLHKRMGSPIEERLKRLTRHPHLVQQRDDLTVEYVTLLNLSGRPAESLDILLARRFHPWEGGEGKVTGQYVLARVDCARQRMQQGQFRQALDHLKAARTYPENLGEGKLIGARDNDILYYQGLVYREMAELEQAKRAFQAAAIGDYEPASALYYNDQPPD